MLSVICFSCTTIHYLSAPIIGIPNIGLQTNLKSNGILVASNFNLRTDTAYFEECLDGLRLIVEAKSEIEIADEIFFVKCPDTAILMELKAKYNVDGLLLLTKLRVQKKCFDVPIDDQRSLFVVFNNEEISDEVRWPTYNDSKPLTSLNVKIISQWEYHDFTTGKSYMFGIQNNKVLELGQYVADIDSFMEENSRLLNHFFYLNGALVASNLIGLSNVGIRLPVPNE